MEFFVVQFLTGLAGAATLFLVAAGLTVIFGVTRVVNFAHGSLCMLGAYIGWTLLTWLPRDPAWFVLGVVGAALATAVLGCLLEMTLLRHVYRSPELFQLLATFGVVLIVQDLTPLLWGPADLPLPRPPWLRAFVTIAGQRFPSYDLALIALAPMVLVGLWLLQYRTRFGVLIRAATEDRSMAAALGVNQTLLFTAVFALGSGLAGLAGALSLPDSSANLQIDLAVIVEAFVVVVVGGLGSVTGAYLASLLIGEMQAFGIVLLPQATLILTFVAMAGVLVVRPNGLLGSDMGPVRGTAAIPRLLRPAGPGVRAAGALAVAAAVIAPFVLGPYPLSLLTEGLIAMVFAASLHLMMGPGGMPSFGHAAWFGLGAYAAALTSKALAHMALAPWAFTPEAVLPAVAPKALALPAMAHSGLALPSLALPTAAHSALADSALTAGAPALEALAATSLSPHGMAAAAQPIPLLAGLLSAPLLAGVTALAFGSLVVRLSGVYLAMLTLAFAQIVWAAATQWSDLTGGDDGILGLWPGAAVPFYWIVLALSGATVWFLRRTIYAPFGYALRATRDSELRATAIGLGPERLRLAAFALSGAAAGLSGGLFAFAKGSVFPGYVGIGRSVDALLMVLLGGVQTVSGPVLGALAYTGLYDLLLQAVPLWRLALGGAIIALVVLCPDGLASLFRDRPKRSSHVADPDPGPVAAPCMRPVAAAADRPLLEARLLRKDYGGVQAVANVSLHLAAGEIVALIGPNGAGKSTCFNLLNGQVRPDGGQVRLDGIDITGWPPQRIVRLGVGRSFQTAATFASMTVRENVQLALLAHQGQVWHFLRPVASACAGAADDLLRRVGLAEAADHGCATLAYGALKRLELALALANAPRLLLMDEPAAGLDRRERQALMGLVRQAARERGCAVLFTEHDMDVVFGSADRILVMDRGRLIAEGDAAAIRADPIVRAAYLG